MVRKFLTALVLCTAFGGQATLAAPVAYDEAVSGDINRDLFAFDVGTNTISGTMRFVRVFNSDGTVSSVSDFDLFSFTFGSEDLVTGISIRTSFTPIVGGQTGAVGIDWRLVDNSGRPASDTCQRVFGAPSQCGTDSIGAAGALFDDVVPLSLAFAGGRFGFGPSVIQFEAAGEGVSFGGDIAYALTFEVASKSVPEPGTLALLGVGLVGLAALRRRKH